MKRLLIVESPAKIKTISKFLPKDFKIMSTMGHVKDLPESKMGVEINSDIVIDYEVLDGKKKTLDDICKEAKGADEVFLAPDPDREGEIIAWHVEQEIIKNVKNVGKIHRIAFNEITKTAIEEAISHPGNVDLNKVSAQQARRILDRVVGYEVSPVLWRKITKGLSAGRVQSVALRIICDRETEIRNFKPEEFWTIEATFICDAGKISAPLYSIKGKKIDLKNETQAKKALEGAKLQKYLISSIKDTKRLKNPNPPFMTSTLQQASYNKLGLSVQRTMQVAQNLYEGINLGEDSPVALITYMRTDSLRISDTALGQVREFISKNYSKSYLPTKSNIYVKGKAQDAHEAIRPVDVSVLPDHVRKFATKEQSDLYELIWKRFVASQSTAAEYAQRQVTLEGGDYKFRVTGSTLIFDGFLKIYKDEDEAESDVKLVIPKNIKESDSAELSESNAKQHFTQPPARFTEASLVKDLEKEGIGRPSTYASILKTIQARSYTSLDAKKRFLPTDLGFAVVNMLVQNLPKIMDLKFTAHMEEDLDKIAQGDSERDKVVKDFYHDFEKDLEVFKGETKKYSEPTEIMCPECKNHKLIIRFGKSGEFLGCPGYPDCKYTSNFKRTDDGTVVITEPEKPELLSENCPECKSPLRQLQGRFGKFTSCSGYPKCNYIKQEKASFKCLQCNKGDIVKRVSKSGEFWACNKYPECKFLIPGILQETPCPKCHRPFMIKKVSRQGEFLFCSLKDCK